MFNIRISPFADRPFHYKIADLARDHGSPQYSGGWVDFLGSLIHPNDDMANFKLACARLNALAAFAILSDTIDIYSTDPFRNTSFVVDAAQMVIV